MIRLHNFIKIQKVPDYNNKLFGKVCISSSQLSKYVGQKKEMFLFILEPGECAPEFETLVFVPDKLTRKYICSSCSYSFETSSSSNVNQCPECGGSLV